MTMEVNMIKVNVVGVRFSDETMVLLKAIAADRDWTLSHVVRYLAEKALKEAPNGISK